MQPTLALEQSTLIFVGVAMFLMQYRRLLNHYLENLATLLEQFVLVQSKCFNICISRFCCLMKVSIEVYCELYKFPAS